MEPLKLVALDEVDLAVISAHLQDAHAPLAEIAYLPREKRFALCMARLEWEADPDSPPRRRLTGLHFERVLSARSRNIDPTRKDDSAELIGIVFEPGDSPSGAITLFFSQDRAVRLEVECIEAQMRDMGPVWEVESRPRHDEDAP
ncbi:MAG: DUF2948 family protein [Salinarimonadaceae bacterium]|nr:MAG: DUF2948 family protein [Salinarimonadaceae bacterium]